MIVLSGFKPDEDIELKFTGLKPGEKLFEDYQHRNEECQATDHPRVMRFVTVGSLSEAGLKELEQNVHSLEANEIKRLVPEYTSFLD
jgi:FlaA1/EpsC-like NDP-sugar epimerase